MAARQRLKDRKHNLFFFYCFGKVGQFCTCQNDLFCSDTQRHDQVTLVHLNSEQFNPSFNQMEDFFPHVNTGDILMKAYVSLPLYYII